MVEVPSRELARRNTARNRVKQAQNPRRHRPFPLEHQVVQHLVQEHREVEDREALNEREGNPDERVIETDEAPGRQSQYRELPGRDDEVPNGRLPVQVPHLLAGDGFAQLSAKADGMLRIVVGH